MSQYAEVKDRNESITLALSALRVDPPILCSEWARQHWHMSHETSPRPGKLRWIPYQPDMADIMTHQNIERVYLKKSARVGYTVNLTIVTAYEHRHRRRTTTTYFPTEALAGKHVRSRMLPAMRDVPEFGKLAPYKKKIVKGEGYFTNGTIYRCYSGHTPNNYRADDVNTVIFDELDGLPMDVGEGDPVTLGHMRTQASPRRKLILGTTPTLHGISLLQNAIETAEVFLEYHMPCPTCGTEQPYRWGDKNGDSGLTYFDDDPKSAVWICPSCGGAHGYEHQRDMVAQGVWRSEDNERWERGSGKLTKNGKTVMPNSVGLYIWSAYSPHPGARWEIICEEHLNCKDNPSKLEAFTNTFLGEWWRDEVIVIEPDPLYARREPYAIVPDEVKCITFGADVQKDRIEISFIGWTETEEAWALGHHILDGDPTRPDIWHDLTKLINEGVKVDEENSMAITLGFIDSKYCMDHVFAYCRASGNRYIYPCRGANVRKAPIFAVPRTRDKEHRVFIATIGTDTCKDIIYRRLEIEEPGPGYIHFQNNDQYDMEFFRQLCGEEKVRAKRGGRWEFQYDQTHRHVEALDCYVYGLAAYRFAVKRRRLREKITLIGKTKILPELGKDFSVNKPVSKRNRKRRQSRQNFFNM